MFQYQLDGRTIDAHFSFYRGENTNFFPADETFGTNPAIVSDFIVKGWMPSEPFIDKALTVVPFGSCFAANVANYLRQRGYNVPAKHGDRSYVTRMGDGMVHTFAIRQQFEWAWLDKKPQGELWHGYKAAEFGYDDGVRLATKALFDSADVFILTLGLSEIWYDEPTGEVFWRAVPTRRYDPARHKFRVSTVAENVDNLQAILGLIRAHRPDAEVIVTLSPVALTATFRPASCLTANSVSKAVLRAAIDEFVRAAADPKLHYFPSYEIVTGCFDVPFHPDRRHPLPHVLDFNMKAFERYFCRADITDAELLAAFRLAQAEDERIAAMSRAERLEHCGFDRPPAPPEA